jgi:hypothetical protein
MRPARQLLYKERYMDVRQRARQWATWAAAAIQGDLGLAAAGETQAEQAAAEETAPQLPWYGQTDIVLSCPKCVRMVVAGFVLEPGPWIHPSWKHAGIFFIHVEQDNMGHQGSPAHTRSDGLTPR